MFPSKNKHENNQNSEIVEANKKVPKEGKNVFIRETSRIPHMND
jgi:hypothetical protein